MAELTEIQERDLERIQATARKLIDLKYRRGAEEHGTILSSLSVHRILDEAIDEAVDLVVYLLHMREKLGEGRPPGPGF